MACKEIDGSVLEGGGQIIRLSVAFSCLLQQPIRIAKIRAGRSKPGLKPQHLAGINLVKQMCNAVTTGNLCNSCEFSFHPKTLNTGNFNLNIDSQTAASIPLMIQSVLPVTIFSNQRSTIIMKGGTDVSFAPSMDYVKTVLFPIYKLFGIDCEARINKRGYYPKGQGEVQLVVNPVANYLKPIQINDFGDNPTIWVFISISGLESESHKRQVANDVMASVILKFNRSGYQKIEVKTEITVSVSCGGSLVLVADTGKCLIGSSGLYEFRNCTVDSVTDETCDKLLTDLKSKSCVDVNAMDNLIIFMALASGKSRVKCREVTLHTKTAIHIAEQFTNAKFVVDQMENGLFEIACEGIGLKID